ncbi:ATP-binding cassette sub-family C member 4-like [Oculina patagonica]
MARNGYKRISTKGEIENFSFVSRLFFLWMNSVFKTGSERALEESDFLPLSEENFTSTLTEQLQTKWNKENTKCESNGKRPRLWKSVLKMLSVKDSMIIFFTGILHSVCSLLQPLFLGYLISALISSPDPQKNYYLYGCALAMGITALIDGLSNHHFNYRCELLSIRIRSSLKGLVYLKTLDLSKHSLSIFTTGQVIDLVSNDVQRLDEQTFRFFFGAAFSPFVLVTAMAMLLVFVGWQAVVGVIFFCFLVPYFVGLSYVGGKLRKRTAAESDRRISLMNEVVSGIRAIKTHAWEDEYRTKIKNTRRDEIDIIREKSAILSCVAGLEYASAPIAALVSVITLVLTGQTLTPVNVFMLLSFINLARYYSFENLANALLTTYEAFASLGRIEVFLFLENLHDKSTEGISNMGNSSAKPKSNLNGHRVKKKKVSVDDDSLKDLDKPPTLCVSGLTHQQIKREDEFILQDIEFAAPSGTLTVITGPVGSGKSTLLSAIAGEIPDTSASITCQGTLVYVPQIAWVFSGTIRDNILFGEPYHELKYKKITEACALTEDIQQFPDNDQTIVGERGAVLSGGQRARVSLARAVYADADIYLLDDPLSAVDVKVGQHIFKKCIKDLLGEKTRLLTSHQELHMKEADEVIMLCKGRVEGKGSFNVLQEQGFLNTTIDQLYKKVLTDIEANKNFAENYEEESENADSCGKMAPSAKEHKGLDISQEDRSIGMVSSKLYWDYFRSGMHPLAIFALICLCLTAQGLWPRGQSPSEESKKIGRVLAPKEKNPPIVNNQCVVYKFECNLCDADCVGYTTRHLHQRNKVERLPPEHWPREGNVTFQDVSLTYYPGGPQVLKKINLSIKGGTKIGVAGRTGAGKSSFVAALMRMPDAEGVITVDGIRVKEINLQESRRCISVLGQTPVLFSGSLRKNLDPMAQFQDADLWRALEDVQLKALLESLEGQLDHELLEHGANVSVGERQLICLARVLLQQNKIIVLDEPTAHVDPETEQTIWEIVQEKLKDSTVITIAHRLNTIKDCDMILVLNNGEVDEFDRFDALVSKEGSTLSEMARGADI